MIVCPGISQILMIWRSTSISQSPSGNYRDGVNLGILMLANAGRPSFSNSKIILEDCPKLADFKIIEVFSVSRDML